MDEITQFELPPTKSKTKLKEVKAGERIVITKPNMQTREFKIIGTSQLVANNFSQEAQDQMAERQKEGARAKSKKVRTPKDFDLSYRSSMHVSTEGWIGHPAATFRQAMVDACRTVGYEMTKAKMAVFVLADGAEAGTGIGLVRIIGTPKQFRRYVTLANGRPDIKAAAKWDKWSIKLRVRFDGDMFATEDIAHLLMRVGEQVGIGAGRHFSKSSTGQGWGCFTLEDM